MAETQYNPIYTDGPLKGKQQPITESTRVHGLMVIPETSEEDKLAGRWNDSRDAVMYRFTVYRAGHLMILIGSTGEPAPADVLELLLNDAARAAVIGP